MTTESAWRGIPLAPSPSTDDPGEYRYNGFTGKLSWDSVRNLFHAAERVNALMPLGMASLSILRRRIFVFFKKGRAS
jgi:hypothetical protein